MPAPMTRTRWLIAGSWLLLFWLLAGLIWAPAIQRALTDKANGVLQSDPANRFADVEAHFDGQHAILTGTVRREAETRAAVDAINTQVRTQTEFAMPMGGGLNPITAITANVEVVPFPAGWVLLAANGARAQLFGIAANEFEARDVTRRIRDRWSEFGGRLDGKMLVDTERFDEAPNAEQTLRIVPPPPIDGAQPAVRIHLARLGGEWHTLNVEGASEARQREAIALGISDGDWQTHIVPIVREMATLMAAQRARAAEMERIAKLPPAHVFLATRDTRVLLRGEVATIANKRSLLEGALKAFPGLRILDDIRVNAARRPSDAFAPLTVAVLPQGEQAADDKSLVLGIPGQAWKAIDWQIGNDARPWETELPKDLPPGLLVSDSKIVVDWLQGSQQGIPVLPLRAQPAFLTMALLPDRVILAGQLAEESLRSQIIDAVRETYGSRAVIMADELLARGTCEPSADVFQTARSLPPLPDPGKPPVVGFAKPGQIWKTAPVTPAILEPGALGKSGLMPSDFPAMMAEDTLVESFQQLRAYLAKPAPVTQSVPTAADPLPLPTHR